MWTGLKQSRECCQFPLYLSLKQRKPNKCAFDSYSASELGAATRHTHHATLEVRTWKETAPNKMAASPLKGP